MPMPSVAAIQRTQIAHREEPRPSVEFIYCLQSGPQSIPALPYCWTTPTDEELVRPLRRRRRRRRRRPSYDSYWQCVWSAVAAVAAAIYQWIRSLPLWSPAAAVVVAALRPLLIHVVGFSGFLLSLRPSSVVPLPRPFRCAPPRSFGGDSAVLANKRGERPPAGARLGGGGGTSSTAASRADKSPPDSDTPKAAAASAIPDPISAALRATGSAVDMLLHTAQAPALTMQLFFVSVLPLPSSSSLTPSASAILPAGRQTGLP